MTQVNISYINRHR